MMLKIVLQIANPLYKSKTTSKARSGSATGYSCFVLQAEAVEAEAVRVEVETEVVNKFTATALGCNKGFLMVD
jgi:hypothetical protein